MRQFNFVPSLFNVGVAFNIYACVRYVHIMDLSSFHTEGVMEKKDEFYLFRDAAVNVRSVVPPYRRSRVG
jgi:hypothetical protein